MKVFANKPCVLCGERLTVMNSTGETGTSWRIHNYPCKQTLDALRKKTPKMYRKHNYAKFGEFYRCQIDNMKIKVYQ